MQIRHTIAQVLLTMTMNIRIIPDYRNWYKSAYVI
jgi:hypothetical protein